MRNLILVITLISSVSSFAQNAENDNDPNRIRSTTYIAGLDAGKRGWFGWGEVTPCDVAQEAALNKAVNVCHEELKEPASYKYTDCKYKRHTQQSSECLFGGYCTVTFTVIESTLYYRCQ